MNKTALRTIEILEMIADAEQPVGISQISRALSMPKSSASDLLYTLTERGYLTAENGGFVIGTAAAGLGFAVIRACGMARLTQEALDAVHRSTGLAAFVAVPEGDRAVVIDKREPPGPVHFSIRPGTALTLHLTAAGKAILAAMHDEEVGELLGTGCYVTHTSSSIPNYFALLRELSAIRAQGYAVENFEDSTAVFALAAPIYDSVDKIAAALSVTMLKSELSSIDLGKTAMYLTDAAMRASKTLRSTKTSTY